MSSMPTSSCANCSALSHAPLRTRGSDAGAARSAPATASWPPDHTRCTTGVTPDGVIDVVRVLHQRMDVNRHL
jgi:hypothetical protein